MVWLSKNWRSVVFALIVGLGVVFIQQLASVEPVGSVILATAMLVVMLLMEIFVVYNSATKLLRQLDLPTVEVYGHKTQIVYHLVIPVLSLLAIVSFVVTNNQRSLSGLYMLLTWILFAVLFINVRAYYEDKYKLEQQTHVIYDILKVVLFFASADVIFNLASRHQFNFFVVAGLVFVTASILTLLVLLRHPNLGYLNMGLVLCSGLAIGYMGAALRNLLVSQNLLAAFYVTLVFYMANAILHHELERTLKINIVVEYLLVAAICFLIILLLT